MNSESTLDYYNNFANDYFNQTYTTDLSSTWIKFTSFLKKNDLILDLGSGSGRDLKFFSTNKYRIIGIDYSLNLAKLAKSYSNQSIITGDIRNIPIIEGSFNAIWSIGSLLHISHNKLPNVLLQLKNALISDGMFFSAIKKGSGDLLDLNGRFTAFYQIEEWISILNKNNFAIISIEEVYEYRIDSNGNMTEITWIECLSRRK